MPRPSTARPDDCAARPRTRGRRAPMVSPAADAAGNIVARRHSRAAHDGTLDGDEPRFRRRHPRGRDDDPRRDRDFRTPHAAGDRDLMRVASLVIEHLDQLWTVAGTAPRSGLRQREIAFVADGAVAAAGDHIIATGTTAEVRDAR